MTVDVGTQTHEETTRLDSHELVRRLVQHLGPTLVALMACVRDSKQPYKWAKSDGPEPRHEALQRLQVAHRVWMMLSAADSEHLARNWFIGANPRLGEEAPVVAIREGRYADVIAAATAFTEGTDD